MVPDEIAGGIGYIHLCVDSPPCLFVSVNKALFPVKISVDLGLPSGEREE